MFVDHNQVRESSNDSPRLRTQGAKNKCLVVPIRPKIHAIGDWLETQASTVKFIVILAFIFYEHYFDSRRLQREAICDNKAE